MSEDETAKAEAVKAEEETAKTATSPPDENEQLIRERLALHKARQQAEIERKEKLKPKGRKQGNAKAKR